MENKTKSFMSSKDMPQAKCFTTQSIRKSFPVTCSTITQPPKPYSKLTNVDKTIGGENEK